MNEDAPQVADPIGRIRRWVDEAGGQPRHPIVPIVVPPATTEQVKHILGPGWRDRFNPDLWHFEETDEEGR